MAHGRIWPCMAGLAMNHQKLVAHAASDHFVIGRVMWHIGDLIFFARGDKKTLVGLPITFCQTWVLRAAAKTTASWSWLAMENCHLLCTQTKPTYWSERNVLNHRSEHKQLRTGQCSPLKLRVSTHLGTKGLSHTEIAGKLCGSQEPLQDATIQEPKPGYT